MNYRKVWWEYSEMRCGNSIKATYNAHWILTGGQNRLSSNKATLGGDRSVRSDAQVTNVDQSLYEYACLLYGRWQAGAVSI